MMISKNHTPDHASDSTIHPSPSEIAAWDSNADTNHTHSLVSFSGIGLYNPPSYNLQRALYSTNIDPNDNNNFDEVVLFISKQNNILSKETAYSDMYVMNTTPMTAVSATRSGPVMLLLPNGNMLIVVASSDTVLSINELILATGIIKPRGTINITGPSGSNLSISAKLMPNGLVLIGYKYSPTVYRLHTYNCMSNELVLLGSSITVTAAASIHIATLNTTTMIIGVTSSTTQCSLWLYNIPTSTIGGAPVSTISGLVTSANYIRVFEMSEGQVMVSVTDQGSVNSSFYTYNDTFGLVTLPVTIPNPSLPPDIVKIPGTTKYLIVARFTSGVYRLYIYDDFESTLLQSEGAPEFFSSTSSYLSIKILPNGKFLIMYQYNPTSYYFLVYNPETDKLEETRSPTVTVTSAISKPSIVVAPDNTIYAIARTSTTVYSIYRLNGSFGKMNPMKLPIQHLLSRWI